MISFRSAAKETANRLRRRCGNAVLTSLVLFLLPACSQGDAANHSHHHDMAGETSDVIDAANAPVRAADATLPYFESENFTPIWLDKDSAQLKGFHKVPAFSFVNQDGKTVSSADYDGKIYVATFFFATCPGICSPVNERLLTVQKAIRKWDDVRILSHSITPEIDTVEVLHRYAKDHSIDSATWDLVTGERHALYQVAKQGYFASEDMGETEAEGDFKHTENLLLIDRNGHIRGIYNGLSRNSILDLVADITLLRNQEPAAAV